MPKKPEIVIVSVPHASKYMRETLEGLNQAGVKKGSLVLIEARESCVRDPNILKKNDRIWMQRVNDFLSSRKAYVSSFEPEEVAQERQIVTKIFEPNSSSAIGADFASEEIMTEVISQKASGKGKIVILTGGMHGPRISKLLRSKGFDIKFINKTSNLDLPNETNYYTSKRRALLKGLGGKYQKSGEVSDFIQCFGRSGFGRGYNRFIESDRVTKKVKPTQLKKMEEIKASIKNISWTMPTTFKFGRKGKLIPLPQRAKTRK